MSFRSRRSFLQSAAAGASLLSLPAWLVACGGTAQTKGTPPPPAPPEPPAQATPQPEPPSQDSTVSEFDYTVQFRNKRPADILAAVAQQPFPMAVFPASSTFTCCVVSFEHSDRIIEKVGGIAVAFQFYSSHGLSLHLYEDGEYKGRIVVDASVLDVPDFAITPKNRHGMDREAWKGLLSEEQLDTVESRLDDDHHALAAFIAEALGIDRYRNLSPDDLEYGPEGLREQGATLRL